MKKNGMKEAEVLKECLFLLKRKGIFCWRQNTGAFETKNGGFFRSSIAGVSDILGILPDGRFLAVECKRESGGVVSEKQKQFIANIKACGGVAVVVHSGKELREYLEELWRKDTSE